MDLNTKVQYLTGVGPKMAVKLNRLGVETISDLIFYYPRTYKDFSNITKISDIRYSNKGAISIKGTILGIANKKTSRRHFTVTEAVVEDGTGSLKVIWFNQPFLAKMLTAGREVILNGKVQYNFFSKEVVMESPERAARPSIVPVYGETAGITSAFIRRLISKSEFLILPTGRQVSKIEEYIPAPIIKQYKLLNIQEALINIHQPENREMLERARRRIAFDELFMIALRASLSREELKKENAPKIEIAEEKIAEFVKNLPFELTGDQKKSAWQIIQDLGKNKPMNRLLNGDVGSGKTVVAAIAAFIAVKAGYKVAIMAPTEILAQQHFKTFCKLFDSQSISVGLYTSNCKDNFQFKISNPPAGRAGLKSISKSKILNKKQKEAEVLNSNIIIGTQALIQKDVELENVGLVVVDEQHRFGVRQRAALQQLAITKMQDTSSKQINNITTCLPVGKVQQYNNKKMRPHFLSMTATPIPRTMHLALFGDLDLSVIREKPKDRKEIQTRFVEKQNREKAYEFIRKQIKVGRQAFVICPLIEQNTDNRIQITELFAEQKKTVVSEYEKLKKIFPEFKIGMLHGKMPAKGGSASGGKSKDEVMAEFSNGDIDILVSTSVVEVGVDVPNATVMMIEDAERFGLAQIHQFRGRVGRAEHQSFCFLFSPTMNPRAIERLRSLEATSDGFKLAEIDLETRGPGAVFGTEQSGLLDLKMANFSDRILIEEVSSAAKLIVESDPELKNHSLLKEKIADYLQNKHLE